MTAGWSCPGWGWRARVGGPARSSMFWGPSRADLSVRPHPSGQSLLLPPPPHPIARGAQALLGPSPSLPGARPLLLDGTCSCAPVCSGSGVSAPRFLPVMERRRGDGRPWACRGEVCPRVGPWGGAALLKEGGRAASGSRPSPSSRAPHAERGNGHRP